MSGNMTIATAVEHIANLTPTYRSPILRGAGAYVLTSAPELPEQLRAAQEERTQHYLTTEDRTTARRKPDHAPRYYVTSYGVLIAWVTLDGRTHYIDDVQPFWYREVTDQPARVRAIQRHLAAIRAAWPERFGHGAMGEPSARVPAGHREDDSTGFVQIVPA